MLLSLILPIGCGEEEIIKVLRERYYDRAKDFIARISSPKEALESLVEQQKEPTSVTLLS